MMARVSRSPANTWAAARRQTVEIIFISGGFESAAGSRRDLDAAPVPLIAQLFQQLLDSIGANADTAHATILVRIDDSFFKLWIVSDSRAPQQRGRGLF